MKSYGCMWHSRMQFNSYTQSPCMKRTIKYQISLALQQYISEPSYSARSFSALLQGTFRTLLQGSSRALLQGTFRALLQGTFKALLQYNFRAALINTTRRRYKSVLCFLIMRSLILKLQSWQSMTKETLCNATKMVWHFKAASATATVRVEFHCRSGRQL